MKKSQKSFTVAKLRKTLGEKIFGDKVSGMISKIETFLTPKDKIIDLGAGTCLFTKILRDKGYEVRAVDIKDRSYYSEIDVFIYDGKKLPFKDNQFDVCLLISVLHHILNPEAILKEAARVSKRLIIHENVITNIFQRYFTYLIDCMMNKELIEPHTNKSDKQWRLLFKQLGLDLVKVSDEKAWFYLQNKLYFLKKYE